MDNYPRLFVATSLAASLALAGCVHSSTDANTKEWIGTPISQLVSRIGRPDQIVGDAYVWEDVETGVREVQSSRQVLRGDGQLENVSTPYNEEYTLSCRKTFWVDANGVIVNARARGDCP